MMADFMLSTSDNPYNPFTDWDQWYAWDAGAQYHTPAYLARIARSSSELSESDQEIALNDAIEEILDYNITGTYIKVTDPSG